MQLTNIDHIPSDRGMAAELRGNTLINICARTGTVKRREREHFYNSELAYLLKDAPAKIPLGGDFKCVLETADTTGHNTYSRALAGLVQGFDMQYI
jgi:hypothetical protein